MVLLVKSLNDCSKVQYILLSSRQIANLIDANSQMRESVANRLSDKINESFPPLGGPHQDSLI